MWRLHSPVVATTWGDALAGTTTWDDPTEFGAPLPEMPVPMYSYTLDSAGPGDLKLRLPRKLGQADAAGDFITDADWAMHNILEVHVFDDDSGTEGDLVYRGRLEEYEVVIEADDEFVDAEFIPLSACLAGTFYIGPKTFTDTDPSDMMKWFLENDHVPGFAWDYDSGTVGTTYTKTFEKQSILAIFRDILKLAGSTYHFVVKRDHTIRFRTTPTTADHALTLGKNVSGVKFNRSTRRQVTRIILYYTGGSVTRTAAEFDPQDCRDQVVVDEKITDETIAIAVADGLLGRLNVVELRGRATVIDSSGSDGLGYDIETIIPGDTVVIKNPEHLDQPPAWGDVAVGTTIWDGDPAAMQNEVLLVTKMTYRFDEVVLEFSDRQPSNVVQQDELREQIIRHLTEAT